MECDFSSCSFGEELAFESCDFKDCKWPDQLVKFGNFKGATLDYSFLAHLFNNGNPFIEEIWSNMTNLSTIEQLKSKLIEITKKEIKEKKETLDKQLKKRRIDINKSEKNKQLYKNELKKLIDPNLLEFYQNQKSKT